MDNNIIVLIVLIVAIVTSLIVWLLRGRLKSLSTGGEIATGKVEMDAETKPDARKIILAEKTSVDISGNLSSDKVKLGGEHPASMTHNKPGGGMEDIKAKPRVKKPPANSETHETSSTNVHFTIYHPKVATVDNWFTFLAYVHTRADAYSLEMDAHKFVSEMAHQLLSATSKRPTRLQRGTRIRVVPSAEGIEFNPKSMILKWNGDLERGVFRFRASPKSVGESGSGEVTFYVGPLLIASVKFSIYLTSLAMEPRRFDTPSSDMYKKIFASYSHADTSIVLAVTRAFKAIGYDVLRDYETIRSGEAWKEALKRMIEEADIFQLFWSSHASQSKAVQDEWSYALASRGRNEKPESRCVGFIRPVFWEDPMPKPPQDLTHLHFKYMPELAELTDSK